MSKVNQLRSEAAKASGEHGGLHKQRSGGTTQDMQTEIVNLAARFRGYTIDQLSWIASGGEVDEKGVCEPSALYSRFQRYFSFKRRGSEVAFNDFEKIKDPSGNEVTVSLNDVQIKAKHPHARLVYGKALKNPYNEKGGRGVRLIGSGTGVAFPKVSEHSSPPPVAAPKPQAVKVTEQSGYSDMRLGSADPLPKVAPVSSGERAASHIENLKDMLDD